MEPVLYVLFSLEEAEPASYVLGRGQRPVAYLVTFAHGPAEARGKFAEHLRQHPATAAALFPGRYALELVRLGAWPVHECPVGLEVTVGAGRGVFLGEFR